MNTFECFASGKTSITHQAFEKFFKGEGNPRATALAVETVEALTVSGDLGCTLQHFVESIQEVLNHGATVFIYSNNTYFANHRRSANPDSILLKYDGTKLYFVFLRPANSHVSFKGDAVWDGKTDILELLKSALLNDDFNNITLNSADVGYFAVLPSMYLIPGDEFEHPSNWDYTITQSDLKNKFDKPEKTANNNNVVTQNQNSTGEVKMKVSTIVTANKTAAVSVAKIEAGRIAVKQAVKLVKPAVPMMARGYLESALGELVVANVFKFAVDNFAQGNEKAQVVADAMLQGAMLGAIQSLNVEQMIADVLDKVDISKFTEVVNSGE